MTQTLRHPGKERAAMTRSTLGIEAHMLQLPHPRLNAMSYPSLDSPSERFPSKVSLSVGATV
jgi:hypothetical protein